MRYAECVDYLSRLGTDIPVAKSGLDNIRKLLEGLGNPQRRFPSVLIAGTNGKGSVAAFLSSILTSSGLKTGLYTSPHLMTIEERIAIDGRKITAEAFAECISRTVERIQRLDFASHPTFFETVTSAAFFYFAEQKLDIVVVEAGMGGRTDSTNVLEPVLSVITPISIDHQQYLGQSVEEITRQKAGIIHRHGRVVSAGQTREARAILEQEATRQEAVLWYAEEAAAVVTNSSGGQYRFQFRGAEFEPELLGRHQVGNAVLALSAATLLAGMGHPITPAALVEGVHQAWLPGRIQKISEDPAVFLDGAHNDEALLKLTEFVSEHTRRPRALVFGMMSDKQLSSSIPELSRCFDTIYLTAPKSSRAATHEQLLTCFPSGIWIDSPVQALSLATPGAETVVVTGSLYLVGELLSKTLRQD